MWPVGKTLGPHCSDPSPPLPFVRSLCDLGQRPSLGLGFLFTCTNAEDDCPRPTGVPLRRLPQECLCKPAPGLSVVVFIESFSLSVMIWGRPEEENCD